MALPLTPVELAGRLAELIRRREPGATEVRVEQPMRLRGGNARQAWTFTAHWNGRCEHCVLLARVEPGQLEVDPQVEFDVLSALVGSAVPAPAPFWLDAHGEVLGTSGMVMRRGTGRSDIVELLRPDSVITRPLAGQLVRIAAQLHALRRPGLPADWQPGDLLADWRRRYEAVRMEPLPALGFAFDWLQDRLPRPCQAVLVHGDLRLGNFLHDGECVTMLLDWELAHVGDPVEDIAWMYRRLWSPQAFLPLESALRLYEEAGGGRIEPARLLWYRVFCEARLAVISLAAVRRFMDGDTANLRHAGRVSMVNECLLTAIRFIDEAGRR